MRLIASFLLASSVFGCDSDESSPSTTTTTQTSDATANTEVDVDPDNGCGARVLIAFFDDADCTNQVGQRTYDTSQTCFSWTAQGSHAGENSATRFQCYRDRLCYTQHADTLTCEGGNHGQTDKEAQVGHCIKEPAGQLYSKVVSGTEGCPEAPADFECPASGAEDGTPGIVACGEAE